MSHVEPLFLTRREPTRLVKKVVMIPNQPPVQSDEEFYENYMTGTHFLSSGFDGFYERVCFSP